MPALEFSTEAGADARETDLTLAGGVNWPRVRWAALAVYVVGCGVFLGLQGIPTDRLGIYAAIIVLLSIVMLGRGWAAWWQMICDWLPFQAVLLAYDYSRGLATPYTTGQLEAHQYPVTGVQNSLGLPLHVHAPIRADLWIGEHLGMGGMPTTWVQEHLHPGTHAPWYSVLVSLTYCSHFLVMPTVAVVLWLTNRDRFRVWMRMVVALAVAGVTTYFLYPMAPPWLANDHSVFPGGTVGRYTSDGFDLIGLHMVGGALDQGQRLVNPVAAMPSLHMAYATLAAGFFWFGARWWVRCLLPLYPLAMGIALVYGGEHYVIDEIAGAVYALVIIAGWRWLRARRITRASAQASG
ncbi:MAG TPA: phosphatase PAP2 family protein [Nocardioides sp.]|nr:phosphatase PAP2 family protein [Nocardioides sp.]